MSFISKHRKNIILLFLAILVLAVFMVNRDNLLTYYFSIKYSDQTKYVNSVIQLIAQKDDDSYKSHFIKDSWFLSNPIYISEMRRYFREIDTTSFRPYFARYQMEKGENILFMGLENKDKYRINFKLKYLGNNWIIVTMHGDL